MRPAIWQAPGFTNFGDALNLWLWERLGLRPFFSAEKPGLLYGIGTILNEPLSKERPLIVFGSGVGYGQVPDLTGVDVMFVRGPRSSTLLGGVKWLTDPAILVARMAHPSKREGTIFVPHWQTAAGDPELATRLADVGIRVVDPRWPVETVLHDINTSDLVLAEAMHAAIVADALRIPWIPISTPNAHLFKWLDWTGSMELPYEPEFPELQSMLQIKLDSRCWLSDIRVHHDRLAQVDRQVELLRERLSR